MESVNDAPLTPLGFLRRSAAVFPHKTAIVHGTKRYTYSEFASRVNRLAAALRNSGIEAGDRVAVLAPNIPPLLEAHYGVPAAGAALVAINTRLTPREIAYIVNHSGAKLFIVDSELASGVEPVLDELKLVRQFVNIQDDPGHEGIEGGTEYEEFLGSAPSLDQGFTLSDELALISINYTSGTTGNPKGVMYSHRGAYLNSIGQVPTIGLSASSVYLWTLPMFHTNGWCFTWAVTSVGATHVCLRRFDPAAVLDLVVREGVTHLCGAPIILNMIVNHPGAESVRFPNRIQVATGGAAPSPTLIGKLEAMGAELIHLYGLTETYGPNTLCEPQSDWSELDATSLAGLKARQGVSHVTAGELRVVDDEMRDVPADGETMGEVVMRGNTIMLGYFQQPDATAEAFRGGWFHSGDLGVMHPDGYIELRDRAKDVIISGGENISTIEVENVIYQHPAVLEVAVVAVPDERWGEVPKAFVALKPEVSLSEADLIAFCREHMAHFKAPKSVEFCEIPKTSTGKIQKFALREKEWEGRERRIN